MRFNWLLPVLAGLVAGGAIAAEPHNESDRIFDIPYLMRELDNGLKVIIVRTDFPDIVSIQIPVQTGSRNEVEPGKSGFAHFFEHMMFRGTESYPAERYNEILKNAGADQNAYTTDDYTNYHITFTRADLEQVLELEADRFRNLDYSEELFRTEALAVKGEYLKNYSNPVRKIFEVMRNASFTRHPYKHTTMGFLEDIEAMPDQMPYSREFFDRWYRPEKSAVILVGDVEPEKAFALVEEHFGGWQRGSFQVDIPAEPAPAGPVYEHLEWEAPTQPWIMTGFRGPAFDPRAKDMPAMDILAEIYFSETSELYQKLVIEERLVDQLWTSFPNRKDPNLLVIAARLMSPENAPAVRDAISETLVRARTAKVDARKLGNTKSRLRYQFTKVMDNSESIAEMLAAAVQFERTPETINELYSQYQGITADDLLRSANRYFTDAGRVTVSLSNEDTLAGMDAITSLDAAVTEHSDADTVDIRLVEMRSGASPLVDVSFLFGTGAAFDPPGKKGLAALTAAMISDGGSELRSIQDINAALYPMAAGFDAQVDKEMTRLSGTVHKDKFAAWYEIAMEQLLQPGWREEDFERIKTQTINAIRTNLVGNNDEELGKELLYEFIYGPEHPYGSLNLGHVADVQSLTLEDVKGFYARYYTPANLSVGLAGGYNDALPQRLRVDLGLLPRGVATTVALTSAAGARGHEALIVQKETPAVAVSFGFPVEVRRGDPDWVALWLVRSWLGEHRSTNSHLFQRIRELRGMNYGDYAYIEYFPRGMFQFHPDANLGRQQQIFQVWVRPLRNNNDAHFATRVAMHELEKLIAEGITPEDFEATRNFLEKFVALLVKTQSRQLGYRLDSDYYGIGDFTEYVRSGLAALTRDEVNRVIRDHLQTGNIKFVFVTKDAEDLRARLIENRSSPIEYNTPKPELAEEDRLIQDLALGFSADSVRILPSDEVF